MDSSAPKLASSSSAKYFKSVPVLPQICQDKTKLKIGIVRAGWNGGLVDPFVAAIKKCLAENGIALEQITEILVPGSFEIPLAAKNLSSSVDAVIAVGVLLKGETLYFEMICESIVHALMKTQLDTGVPIVNAVFNCLTEAQAQTRCNPTSQLVESLVATAIYMASLNQKTLA